MMPRYLATAELGHRPRRAEIERRVRERRRLDRGAVARRTRVTSSTACGLRAQDARPVRVRHEVRLRAPRARPRKGRRGRGPGDRGDAPHGRERARRRAGPGRRRRGGSRGGPRARLGRVDPRVPRNVALLTLLPYAKYTREPGGADDLGRGRRRRRREGGRAGRVRGRRRRRADATARRGEGGSRRDPARPTSSKVAVLALHRRHSGAEASPKDERTQHTRVARRRARRWSMKRTACGERGVPSIFCFSRLEVSGFARVDVTAKIGGPSQILVSVELG